MCVYVCVCVCTYVGHSKSSNPQQERRIIIEYFSFGNILSLFIKLEKLIQISVLIFVQVRPIQMCELCVKFNIWLRLITFWITLVCKYVYVCI